MKLEKAKGIAQYVIDALKNDNYDDILDDGRDQDDWSQNNRFTIETRQIEHMQRELSNISIDGIDGDVLDKEWIKAWKDAPANLPESKYNHAINYATWILSL